MSYNDSEKSKFGYIVIWKYKQCDESEICNNNFRKYRSWRIFIRHTINTIEFPSTIKISFLNSFLLLTYI